jgi:hypothetical protein
MVNIKNNSVELSPQKFKSLILMTSAFTPEKLERINYITELLKARQLILHSKIEFLTQLNEGFSLNNVKEDEQSVSFLQFFLHCCQQQHHLISFNLENIQNIVTAAKICNTPENQNNISLNLIRENLAALNNLVLSLQKIDIFNKFAVVNYQSIKSYLEKIYSQLMFRHTINNIKVYHNIIITDLCVLLLDSFKKDSNSFKLKLAQDHIRNEIIFQYLKDSSLFDNHLEIELKEIVNLSESLQGELSAEIFEVKNIVSSTYTGQEIKKYHVDIIINQIKALSLNNIQYQENISLADKKINYKLYNSVCESCVKHLLNEEIATAEAYASCLSEIEKAESNLSSSGFYICKIAAGNPDKGEPSGSLELVPKQKPNVTLDNIVGSGFEEIKNFIAAIKFTSQWNDLFLATSPSKTTDKSNVLLIGPPGCGKTEILRAVASDPDSISVFAQGSDFLTCWRGEAEKNPKRLFEAGIDLQKKSKKHVYFLIDEIDSVLNAGAPGEINLSLEFQVLMDGVIQYPGLSVWGATNFPEKIPAAMLRRFSKTNIVGELSQDHRIILLKHFINFMPCKDFNEQDWDIAANKLIGATGNVVRKIADQIWRDKMMEFVNKFPEQASELVAWLNQDGKFDIDNFSSDKKEELKNKLLNYIAVEPSYLSKAIDSHLNNLAVKSEIQTAVNTYANAKRILGQL